MMLYNQDFYKFWETLSSSYLTKTYRTGLDERLNLTLNLSLGEIVLSMPREFRNYLKSRKD